MAIDTIEYRGYTISIMPDQEPINPWEDGDCEPPILVINMGRRDTATGYGIEDAPPSLADEDVRAHWREMLADLEYPGTWRGLLKFRRDFSNSPDLKETLADEHGVALTNLPASDRLECYAQMYRWLGMAAKVEAICGPRQADYAEVLAVATPEWAERVGAPADSHEAQLQGAISLFRAYAYGEVYGYETTRPCSECCSPRYLDSCWGYYGDPEHSGLLDDARSNIDVLDMTTGVHSHV